MATKILAIDDSKTMRLAIKITFAAEDADVTAVSKGSEAVPRAKQVGADIVLVDASLADGEPSGYDVCRTLKEDPGTANIPVIVMVSNQVGADQAKLKAVGADGFIAKPFDSQDLIDKVTELVGKPAAKPAVASAAAAVKAPPLAAKPAAASPASRPAAVPTPARPVAAPPVASRPAPAPAPAAPKVQIAPPSSAARPSPSPSPMARPTAAAAPRPAGPPAAGGQIPIAIPIPFTSADAPTAGMLRRLREAGGPAAGLDPKVAEALVSLSREVIEQVVWEVVPDLAEAIIKRAQAQTA